MECNVGGIDRGLRGSVAMAAIGTALNGKIDSRWRVASGIIGSVASFTFLSRYCPLNQLIGLNTCHSQDQNLEEYSPLTEQSPASWDVPAYESNRY